VLLSTEHKELEVLVVEDEQCSRDETIEYLQSKGLVCHGAPNADIAMHLADGNFNIGGVLTLPIST